MRKYWFEQGLIDEVVMIHTHTFNRLYAILFVALRKSKLYCVEEITLLDQISRQQFLFKLVIFKLIDLITRY